MSFIFFTERTENECVHCFSSFSILNKFSVSHIELMITFINCCTCRLLCVYCEHSNKTQNIQICVIRTEKRQLNYIINAKHVYRLLNKDYKAMLLTFQNVDAISTVCYSCNGLHMPRHYDSNSKIF